MNELEWLRDQRPDVPAPDDDTTAYARTALLAHARDDIAGPRRGSRPDRKAPLYALAAVVFAVAIVVAAGALPSGRRAHAADRRAGRRRGGSARQALQPDRGPARSDRGRDARAAQP